MLEFTNSNFYSNPAPLESEITKAKEVLDHLEKHAVLDSYNVKIFNTSNPDELQEYTKTMKDLFLGVMAKTHVIWAKERTLVNGDWKIYLEWSVYKITED